MLLRWYCASIWNAPPEADPESRELWRQAGELLVSRDHPVEAEATLAFAAEHKLSTCDAQCMVRAQRMHTVLATEDRRLAKAFPTAPRTMHDAGISRSFAGRRIAGRPLARPGPP